MLGDFLTSFETVNRTMWGDLMKETNKDLSCLTLNDYLKKVKERIAKRKYQIVYNNFTDNERKDLLSKQKEFYIYIYLKKYRRTLLDIASTGSVDGVFDGYIGFEEALKRTESIQN
jgi:hypothetical protein